MSFPPYEGYRNTGLRWLEQVPESWRVVPFWSLFRRVKRTGYPDAELLSVYRDYGVIRKRDRDDNFNNPSEDLGQYQLVEPGDLAVNKMKAWQGSLGISEHRGIVSPAYFVYRSRHEEMPAYLHYLLRSGPFATGFMTISKGIRTNQWDVDPGELARLPIPLPTPFEQAAIAAFLDRETAKIDALVEQQRRLIALLEEKRRAVISRAVTQGLDPKAPKNGSDFEWLGEVPAHWEVAPLKRKWSITDCKHITAEFVDDGIPLASIREVQGQYVHLDGAKMTTDSFYNQLCEGGRKPIAGDLIFSRNVTVGEVAQVADWHPPFAMGQDVCLLRKIDGEQSTDFLQAVLRSHVVTTQLAQLMIGTTFKRINVEQIRELMVPFPPPAEQAEIASALMPLAQEHDALIGCAEAGIKLLQERRATLISAAVTGKIDVRGAAPVQVEAA